MNENQKNGYLMLASTQFAMGFAALFFFFDAVLDLATHFSQKTPYSTGELLHLLLEMVAVAALVAGFFDNTSRIKQLKKENVAHAGRLHHLRKDFESLIRFKFSDWELTAAESDTAMLMLKGFNNEDIANLRNVAIGTVKSQSHSALKKAGLKSRNELMAVFMDEFIDLGVNRIDPKRPD